jgi:TPR repeat protein
MATRLGFSLVLLAALGSALLGQAGCASLSSDTPASQPQADQGAPDQAALVEQAERGSIPAQTALGLRYYAGRGAPQDYMEALHWYQKAADQGSTDAQLALGLMYRDGHGVPQDFRQAAKWFRLAAERGHPFAQLNVGVMYEQGRGVDQDFAEAARWYRQAAEQNNAVSQWGLGLLFRDGHGVPQDDVQAYAWIELAVQGGGEVGAAAVVDRDELAKRMTDRQREQALATARAWKRAAQNAVR